MSRRKPDSTCLCLFVIAGKLKSSQRPISPQHAPSRVSHPSTPPHPSPPLFNHYGASVHEKMVESAGSSTVVCRPTPTFVRRITKKHTTHPSRTVFFSSLCFARVCCDVRVVVAEPRRTTSVTLARWWERIRRSGRSLRPWESTTSSPGSRLASRTVSRRRGRLRARAHQR